MYFKRGQITIFVIVAIVLVAAVVVFLFYRNSLFFQSTPQQVEPIYNSFLSCMEDRASLGVEILKTQGGYIYLPEFEPGSEYMPFSSQLYFLGVSIPYWYYISGNNIPKSQVPTKDKMEEQLARFIEEGILSCSLEEYKQQGFEIIRKDPRAKVKIEDNSVSVSLRLNMSVYKGNESYFLDRFNLNIKTNLGSLYKSALKVYEKEQKTLFLENYTLDVLRLNAPVDGVELKCSPLVWNADEVFDNLHSSIEANMLAIKNKNSKNFNEKNVRDRYFGVDFGIKEDVRFLYSGKSTYTFEVNPNEGNLLVSMPVGNQPGLGVLGFCYVLYHYVYSLRFPVLVQVSKDNEIFQFPLAVIIEQNKPRKALEGEFMQGVSSDICKNKNTLIEVRAYDKKSNPIPFNVSYECFGEVCDISNEGKSGLVALFPQCVNGNLIVKSKGYKELRQTYTVINEDKVDVFLDKLYKVKVRLNVDGKLFKKNAIIYFSLENESSKTLIYPEQDEIELSEGYYEIKVIAYDNSSLNLQEINYEQCIEVPSSFIGGIFGMTKKKCFDVKVPPQIVSNVPIAGGTQKHYILESELSKANYINIDMKKLKTPTKIEDLQNNYDMIEVGNLIIEIK